MGFFKPRRKKQLDLKARFRDPNNPGLHGKAEYETYTDGSWEFELQLTHDYIRLADAGPIDILIDGKSIGQVESKKRRTYMRLTANNGPLAISPQQGQRIDLMQNRQIRLSSRFEND